MPDSTWLNYPTDSAPRHHDLELNDCLIKRLSTECAHLLLAHNAPVKVKNAHGWSPLAEAISYGDRQMSKTPLHPSSWGRWICVFVYCTMNSITKHYCVCRAGLVMVIWGFFCWRPFARLLTIQFNIHNFFLSPYVIGLITLVLMIWFWQLEWGGKIRIKNVLLKMSLHSVADK